MRSNYKRLGDYIRLVDDRNKEEITDRVLGINIDKFFMPSVANVIGTDLSKYKLLKKGYFACNPMHVGRDERLPIALFNEDEPGIVSPAYFMFNIVDSTKLNAEYLMMWFRRPEFDRQCWFRTDGSVRGGISWDDICRMEVPVPPMEEQLEIVAAYKAIENRIALKKKINDNLHEQAQAIFEGFCDKDCTSVPFTSVIKVLGGGTPQTKNENFWNGYIPFFTPKDIGYPYTFVTEKNITDDGLNHCNSRLYPTNTTFVTARGTVGKVSLSGVPMAMNQSCYALASDTISPMLVYFYTLQTVRSLKHKASGAVFDAIVTRDFELETINLMPEQNQIEATSAIDPIMCLIHQNQEENLRLVALRDVLLPKLMSGELDVSNVIF